VLDEEQERADVSQRSVRLLLILEEVARMGVPATPTEINRSIGLPKQTLHRMFNTLEELGFLQREHDGRSYGPGARLRNISVNVMSSNRVRAARLAVMSRLADEIGETCNLAIPGRSAMIYLDRVETKWPLRIQLPIGTRVPFHCTASGKLYLSTLTKSRLERVIKNTSFNQATPRTITDPSVLLDEVARTAELGYSEDNEEFIEGMVALAVPILDSQDRFVSSLAFHAPTPRMPFDRAKEHLPRLQEAAGELSDLLTEETSNSTEDA
jgi:DNA-binding IclR family transcriptional regulator